MRRGRLSGNSERSGPRAAIAASALARIARDAASTCRYDAVKRISRIDPQHDAIVPAMIGLLSNRRPNTADSSEESEVIMTLGLMGRRALPAVPSLIRILQEKTDEPWELAGLREKAARALGRIGPVASDVIRALVNAMKSEHSVRMAAANASPRWARRQGPPSQI